MITSTWEHSLLNPTAQDLKIKNDVNSQKNLSLCPSLLQRLRIDHISGLGQLTPTTPPKGSAESPPNTTRQGRQTRQLQHQLAGQH